MSDVEQDKLKKIEDMIVQYGVIEGDHHRAWVIDQIMRIIKVAEYDDFVKEFEYTDDDGNLTDEKLYEWEVGIPP